MSNTSTPFVIYPSQLESFKEKSELLAESISHALSIKKISAFKRNDFLAKALGYKGHSDLVESAKFRSLSGCQNELILFSNKAVRQSIAEVYASEFTGLSHRKVILSCLMLSEDLHDRGVMAYATADNLCSLMVGLMHDTSGKICFKSRARILLSGILGKLIGNRDGQGTSVSLEDVRNLLPLEKVQALAGDLAISDSVRNPLNQYLSELCDAGGVTVGFDVGGISSKSIEQHNYLCSNLNESILLMEKSSMPLTSF